MKRGILRKGIPFVLSFFMVLSICGVSIPKKLQAAEGIVFTVTSDKQELKRGDTVTVTVTMSGNTDACGLAFYMDYDNTKLSLNQDPIAGEVTEGAISMPNFTEEQAIIVVISTNTLKNGTVMTANFKVLEDAEPGEIHFGFDEIEVSDGNAVPITDYSVHDNTDMSVNIPATGIELNREAMTIAKGEKEQLTAILTPADSNSTVTWSSSDTRVATVAADGTVTALEKGRATITAMVNGISAFCEVDVVIPLESISVTSEDGTDTIRRGQTLQLNVVYNPSDTTDDTTVIWRSSSDRVATVDQNGLVTARADGQAVITAEVNGKTAEFTVNVQEIKLTSIELNKENTTIHRGSSEQLTVIYNPENTTDDKNVVWESSDPDTVSVDGSGNVSAKKIGAAVITAHVGNYQAKCTVTVDAPLEDIYPENSIINMTKNQTAILEYTLVPEDTTDNRSVTFTTSDPEIVVVDKDSGEVRALKEGTAQIILTGVNGITAIVTINVEEIPIDEVIVDKLSAVVEKGESITIQAAVGPNNTTDDDTDIRWTSSDPSVVVVAPEKTASGENVTVTATDKGGTATITATSANGRKASCTITVPIHIENVDIPDEYTILKGKTAILDIVFNPENTTDEKTVSWRSDNEDVASIDSETGMITAKKEGTAKITVTTTQTAVPHSDTVVLTVRENHLDDDLAATIVFDKLDDSVLKGQTVNLGELLNLDEVIADNQITDDIIIEWFSDNEEVASVDQNGYLTGLKEGTVSIKALICAINGNGDEVGEYDAEIKVEVREIPLESIAFDKVITEMQVGATDTLGIIYNPDDTTDLKDVVWSSSNPDVLAVEDGKLTAKRSGTAEITATVGGKSVTCTITVKNNISDKEQGTEDTGQYDRDEITETDSSSRVPKTGDTSNILLYTVLLLGSLIVLIVSKNKNSRRAG